jgi:hypothetical protein
MAKGRKPAIEVSGRPSVSGGRSPKSPLDDAAKWLAKQGGKQLKKAEIQNIKKYARGIGWSKSYEKSGLDKTVDKKLGKATGLNSWKSSTTAGPNKLKKTKENALALHKDRMNYAKQDKEARVYGDSFGPHDRFFREMNSGRAPRKEFNRRMNSAWNSEVEIARQYGMKSNKAAAKALRPKSKRRVPKKK